MKLFSFHLQPSSTLHRQTGGCTDPSFSRDNREYIYDIVTGLNAQSTLTYSMKSGTERITNFAT